MTLSYTYFTSIFKNNFSLFWPSYFLSEIGISLDKSPNQRSMVQQLHLEFHHLGSETLKTWTQGGKFYLLLSQPKQKVSVIVPLFNDITFVYAETGSAS